ncbi:hypothetical protein C4D60_Mb09t26130 [Musa balbisiana]|uniref:Uncharacterized protein n=1 Tax=Musa balbisiana TaxID=52838 RepID=A0A4S8IJ59_MUSBA|nr:hypothetical protein C4D60_Mb09t26130 [Musa balbisiana]
MATRIAARFFSHGKVLSEEEKAAENLFIKVPSRCSCPSSSSVLGFCQQCFWFDLSVVVVAAAGAGGSVSI